MTNSTLTNELYLIPQAQQQVQYGEGLERVISISPQTTGQEMIFQCVVAIPPGQAELPDAHSHDAYTAIRIEQGSVDVYYGSDLTKKLTAVQGDAIYIPPHVIHFPVNPDPEITMIACVTRTPANQKTTTYNLVPPALTMQGVELVNQV